MAGNKRDISDIIDVATNIQNMVTAEKKQASDRLSNFLDAAKNITNTVGDVAQGIQDGSIGDTSGLAIEDFSKEGFDGISETEMADFRDNGYVSNNEYQSPIRPNNIMGAPFAFISRADPNGRVYNNTFAVDAPIITLMPGEPQFISYQSGSIGEDADAREEIASDGNIVSTLLSTLGLKTSEGFMAWLTKANFKNNTDLRYYAFKVNYREYYKYLQNMLSTVHVKMGLGTVFQFSEIYKSKQSTLNYYVNKDYTVNESFANEFGASNLAGATKSASALMRELRFITGSNLSASELSSIKDKDSEVTSNVEELLSGGWMSKLTMKGGIDKVQTVMNASNLVYPEVWNDSSFTKSISFNMNLFSPYGDPQSIFQYVYAPFVSLLALTMPRHDTLMGYNAPFILKADSPGNFTCDMGVIDQLSYKKGGAEDMWTRDGLPNAIDVSVSIKDLYNVMMMDKSFSMLSTNYALGNYLENMCNIGITDWTVSDNIKNWFSHKVNWVTGIPTRAVNYSQDFLTTFKSATNGLSKFLP